MKIATVQLNADFADVASNLVKCERHIREATVSGAELVVLPEFFTSAIGFSKQMLDVAKQNTYVQQWMKQVSSAYNVIIGGSYIAFDGEHAFNAFDLVFPNGEVFEHKKDIPTQFENCYYTNGDENNVLITPIGNIGVALCWEMIRYDTLRRIAGNVDLVLAGSCWWDLPLDAPPEREGLRLYNQNLALETPATFARLSGVPIVHASHCGQVTANHFPDAETVQTRQLVGAAQIVDGTGHVLDQRPFIEGGGVVLADISWDVANREKEKEFSSAYWIPNLPDSYLQAWEHANPIGKRYYEEVALPYYTQC